MSGDTRRTGRKSEAGRARAERDFEQRRGAGVGEGRVSEEMEKKGRQSGRVIGGGKRKC